MKLYNLLLLTTFSFVSFSVPVYGQTCGCASAPLLGSFDSSPTPSGSWHFGLTYDYNSIKDLVTGSGDPVNSNTRRTTHSGLFEISHGFSEHWAFTTMLTLIRHERKNSPAGAPGTGFSLTTKGVGDAAFILKYALLQQTLDSPFELSVGVGVKIPLGSSELEENSIVYPEDMQPGTGAWDGILLGYGTYALIPSGLRQLFISSSYRHSGTNDRNYRFGSEFIGAAGLSLRTGGIFDYSLMMRYRSAAKDRRNNWEIPNTGGKWVYAIPGINLSVSDTFSVRLSGKIPLYRNLDGTQLTTRFTASLTFYYTLTRNQFPAL